MLCDEEVLEGRSEDVGRWGLLLCLCGLLGSTATAACFAVLPARDGYSAQKRAYSSWAEL